jgi:hypothetical protein
MLNRSKYSEVFLPVPGFEGTLVNRFGVTIDSETKKPLRQRNDGQMGLMRVFARKGSEVVCVNLARLVALTFVPVPDQAFGCAPRLLVGYHDYDKQNVCADNLFWTTTSGYQKRNLIKKREKDLISHPLPNFSKDLTGLFPNPIECVTKQGYFYIPFSDSPIVVNKKGYFFNLLKNNEYRTRINPRGYKKISLLVGGEYRQYSAHRIVAMLFCPIPERHRDKTFDDLQVNHIDGNKNNNSFENLEWVINAENMAHARKTGLFSNELPVLIRDVRNNEITSFKSISETARFFKVAPGTLAKHLHSPHAGRILKNWCVIKFDDGKPWPEKIAHGSEKNSIAWACNIVATSSTGEIRLYRSLFSACVSLGLNFNYIKNTRARHGNDYSFDGWRFSFETAIKFE